MSRSASPPPVAVRALYALAGVALGLIAGAVLLSGTVVARAHLQEVFLYSSSQLLDADLIPTGILVVVLAVTGFRSGRALGRTAIGAAAGLAIGVLAGAGMGCSSTERRPSELGSPLLLERQAERAMFSAVRTGSVAHPLPLAQTLEILRRYGLLGWDRSLPIRR